MPNYPARQAEPGQTFQTRESDGVEVNLSADANGLVRPRTLVEHRAAEHFALPLADGEEPYDGPLHAQPYPDDADPDALSRDQLRDRAKELGLPTTGTKTDLADRIAAAEAGGSEA